ncbi:MAG: hypothetical protein LIO59_05205 [Oscillospiraceae bacterium]|nr:hypothetical protein [Oscillospiraceae bacterium]
MKKILGIILAAGVIALSSCGTNSVYRSDTEITVDNLPIQGYSVSDTLMVALEDLQNFGINTEVIDGSLHITTYKPQYTDEEVVRDNERVGKIEKSYAYVNGVRIDTYTDGSRNYASVESLGNLEDDYNKEWGYSDYNMRLDESENGYNLDCFRFTGEAGEVTAEIEKLVCSAEYDLYTETDDETVHYGGLFEPQSGVIAGIISDGNGDESAGRQRNFEHGFACYSNYIDFDAQQEIIYKPGSELARSSDCVMHIPWNTENVSDVYENEEYIRKMLDKISEYNKPVIIRYACEMNIGSRGDSPSAYVKAFRYMADIVHEYGMATMWSPNDVGSYNRPMSLYYPGDEYVDWIGISSFMKPEFMEQPTSRGDAILFNCADFAWHTNSVKYVLKFMRDNNISKPLAISEGAVASEVKYEGSALSDEWAEKRLGNMYWYLPMVYPEVKMITYFDHSTPDEKVGYDFSDKENYKQIVEDALVNGPYLLNYSDSAKFTFAKAAGREYCENIIPLYEYVYLPEEETVGVKYILDGAELAALTQIPYRYELDTASVSDGGHTLTVEITGSKNTYIQEFTLEKSNESVFIT